MESYPCSNTHVDDAQHKRLWCGAHQITFFTTTSSFRAGPGVQARRQQKLTSHLDAGVKSISLGRGAFVQHRRRASCGTTTCRMMMSGGFGRPAGDSGASGKASTKKGKGKV